jgi:hypothetical protein
MANKKITDLTLATLPLGGGELFEVVQTGVSLKVTASNIAASYITDAANVLRVANGGTGATTLTGYVKGTGTTAMTAAATVPYNDISGRAYGIFYDATDQTFVANTPTTVKYNVTGITSGISVANDGLGNPTRITYAVAGTYEINARFQMSNSDTVDHDVNLWFRLNGTDIANSRSTVTVPKAGDGGKLCLSIVGLLTVTAGQYVETVMAVENAAVTLDYVAPITSPYTAPATPSAILVTERAA